MSSDSNVLVVVAAFGAIGPTLAGLAAYVGTRKNASQKSVDEVHNCLDNLRGQFQAHTEQDRENFGRIDRHFQEQADLADIIRTELVEEAESVRAKVEQREERVEVVAEELAIHDKRPEGFRTTPDQED